MMVLDVALGWRYIKLQNCDKNGKKTCKNVIKSKKMPAKMWQKRVSGDGSFWQLYGYRDSKNFWYTRFKRPISEPIPASKGISLDTVKYAASRINPEVKFTDEACSKLVKVPRVFLNTVLKGCVAWAKENNVKLITEKEMEIIQDKRNKEKKQIIYVISMKTIY